MKKIFLAVLTAVAIVSCSTTDNEPLNEVPREKAFLNIGVKSSDGTRSTAADADGIPDDMTIKNFKAFVVDGDGSLQTGYSSDGKALNSGNEKKEGPIAVSTRAKRVYVIANAGNITLADEAAILNYITDLNAPDGASQSTARWATGSVDLATTDFVQNGNGEWVASREIPLVFIAARITVKIKLGGKMLTDYDPDETDGSLLLKKVLVLNARGESKLFGTSLIPTYKDTYNGGKKFYEGMANPTSPFFHYPGSGTFTVAPDLLSNNINDEDEDFDNVHYYYVFESNSTTAAAFPTIITIEGTYDGKNIYFPVHLAPYEQIGKTVSGVTRGNSYDITITLSGDPNIEIGDYPGGTGGTDDPTNPVVSSMIDVSIKLTDWTPIVLGKEFN